VHTVFCARGGKPPNVMVKGEKSLPVGGEQEGATFRLREPMGGEGGKQDLGIVVLHEEEENKGKRRLWVEDMGRRPLLIGET